VGNLFHHVFAVISTALGIAMVIIGSIWILQGLGIAFLESFMANQIQWTYYGACLALVGLGHIIWTATRGRYFRKR